METIGVLGELALGVGEEAVAVPGRLGRRLLLRLLAARGNAVESGVLIDDVWSDQTSVETVRVQLSRLRRLIAPLGVRITNTGRGWAVSTGNAVIDADVFDGLHERALLATDPDEVVAAVGNALSLWRGRAYADVEDEPWIQNEVTRLTLRRDSLAQVRAEALVLGGRVDDATDALLQLSAERPYDERAVAWLAGSLWFGGRQSDALHYVKNLRQRLRDDLGLDPSPLVRSVELSILRGGEDLRPLLAATTQVCERELGRLRLGRTSTSAPPHELVGRDDEWHQLTDRMATESIAILVGEEGIGKTALSQSVARFRAASDGLLVTGSCTEGSGHSFEPIVDVVRALSAATHTATHDSARLPDELRFLLDGSKDTELSTSAIVSAEQLGAQLAEAITQMRSQRSLVVRLEDLHWASASTLRCIRALIDRLTSRSAPLGSRRELHVILTHRPTRSEADSELRLIAQSAARWASCCVVGLEGLGLAGVCSLLERSGASELVRDGALIAELTSGNPLLVREVAVGFDNSSERASAATYLLNNPSKIEAITLGRVSRLSPNAQELLSFVSCAARRMSHDLMRLVLAPRSEDEVFTALDECLVAGILVDDPSADAVDFRHGYFKRVVGSRIPPYRRQPMHAALARAMASTGEVPGETAMQFWRAGRAASTDEVASSALAASEAARQSGAFDEAEQHAVRGIERVGNAPKEGNGSAPSSTPVFARLLLAHAQAVHQAGRPMDAKLLAAKAAMSAIEHELIDVLLPALMIHAAYGFDGGGDPLSIDLFDRAGKLGIAAGTEASAWISAGRAEHRAMWLGEAAASAPAARTAYAATAECSKPAVIGQVVYSSSMVLVATADHTERLEMVARLETNGRLHGRAIDEARAKRLRGLVAMQLGDRHKVEQIIERAELAATEPGAWYLRNDAARWKACLAIADGSWRLASEHIASAVSSSLGVSVYAEGAEAQKMLIGLELGLVTGDEPLFEQMADQPVAAASLRGARGAAALNHGKMASARVHFEAMLGRMNGACQHRNHLSELGFAAMLAEALEDRERAACLLEWLAPYGGQMSGVGAGEYVLGAIDRFRGSLASLLGDHSGGLSLLGAALEFETSNGWPVCGAHTLAALVRAQARAGLDTAVVHETAQRALSAAQHLGLSPLERRIRPLANTTTDRY